MPTFNWDKTLKSTAVVLGAVATILSTYNRCSINNQQATLDTLKFQSQSNQKFEDTVDKLHDLLAEKDEVGAGNRPMVEFAGLYSIANVQQKLILIEMAQIAGQERALEALSALAENDEAIKSPAPSDKAEAAKIDADLGGIQQRAQQAISAAATPEPRKPVKLPDDPPLTQSINPVVRANASVLAALPVAEANGWVFIGDASGNELANRYAQLDQVTRTTTARYVPHPNESLTACKDVNIRTIPFQPSGELGSVVSIARPGTVMEATTDASGLFQRILYSHSAFNKREPISARWIHVSVTAQSPAPSPTPPSC